MTKPEIIKHSDFNMCSNDHKEYISISSLREFLEKMPNHNGYIENRNSYYKAVDEILQWLQQEVK